MVSKTADPKRKTQCSLVVSGPVLLLIVHKTVWHLAAQSNRDWPIVLIGVLLSGHTHLHNCWPPTSVLLPSLPHFHSLPITSPLTQSCYPENLLMSDCLIAPWDRKDPLHINWGCSLWEDMRVDLEQEWELHPGTVPIHTIETESAVLLDFVCLLCSFWPMSSRFFFLCQLCWVSDGLCDVKYLCSHRGHNLPMWHKGNNEATGKRYCRQT